MNSGVYDIQIDKNSDYEAVISFFEDDEQTPINLQGFTPLFIAKNENRESSKVLFNADSLEIIETNKIKIFISANTTKSVISLEGYYNLILINPTGGKSRVLEGNITFTRSLDEN